MLLCKIAQYLTTKIHDIATLTGRLIILRVLTDGHPPWAPVYSLCGHGVVIWATRTTNGRWLGASALRPICDTGHSWKSSLRVTSVLHCSAPYGPASMSVDNLITHRFHITYPSLAHGSHMMILTENYYKASDWWWFVSSTHNNGFWWYNVYGTIIQFTPLLCSYWNQHIFYELANAISLYSIHSRWSLWVFYSCYYCPV